MMAEPLDQLRAHIPQFSSKAWGDDPRATARIAWRDQSQSILRADLAKLGIDPEDETFAKGFLLGTHYAMKAVDALLSQGGSVHASHLYRMLSDVLMIAERQLQRAEGDVEPGPVRVGTRCTHCWYDECCGECECC